MSLFSVVPDVCDILSQLHLPCVSRKALMTMKRHSIFFTFLVTRCLALTLLPHATATTNPRVLNSRTISLSQATHTIKVGKVSTVLPSSGSRTVARNRSLQETDKSRYMIEPREVVAELGDYIEWQFWSGTHQISRGDFDHPCSPYEDFHPDGQGFSSGEKLVEAPRQDVGWLKQRLIVGNSCLRVGI